MNQPIDTSSRKTKIIQDAAATMKDELAIARHGVSSWESRNHTGMCHLKANLPCNKSAGCAFTTAADACKKYLYRRTTNNDNCGNCRNNSAEKCRFICMRKEGLK